MSLIKKYWWALTLPILILLAAWLAMRIVNSIDFRNNDFFTFWLAGRLAAQGGDPYSPAQWLAGHHEFGVTWIPNQAYVYPLPLSLLYLPLGLLDLKTAYIVWVALSILMMLAALVLLVRSRSSGRFSRYFVPLLVGLIFFRPAVLTLTNGQMSAFLVLLLAVVIYLWDQGKWEAGAAILPLLMLKPNLGAPLVVLLGLWLLVHKRWRSLAVMAGGLLALLLIGILQNPHWVIDYWSIGNLKVSQNLWGVPTLWGLGSLLCGRTSGCTLAFGGVTSALLVAAFIWLVIGRWKDISPFTLTALASAVTLLVTPYIWTYDQLLLLLPVVDLTARLDRSSSRIPLALALFLGVDVLIIVLLVFDTLLDVEIFNALIPLLILMVYAAIRTPLTRRAVAPLPD